MEVKRGGKKEKKEKEKAREEKGLLQLENRISNTNSSCLILFFATKSPSIHQSGALFVIAAINLKAKRLATGLRDLKLKWMTRTFLFLSTLPP